MAYLEVTNLWKSFGNTESVLQGLGFAQERGEILCLLGASGCGKTTVLQILAGLMQADSGRVRLGGRDQDGIPVHARRIGYVFQDHVLFPHLSVRRNVEYGLRMLKWPSRQRDRRVHEMLELVDLAGYGERPVSGLERGGKPAGCPGAQLGTGTRSPAAGRAAVVRGSAVARGPCDPVAQCP